MKSIELTNSQKEKLIEMCTVLFPELIFSWDLSTIGNGILFYRKPYRYFGYKMHWFEFCIKQLIPKLVIDIQPVVDLRILFCELKNPIDYIYAHFEKLKK